MKKYRLSKRFEKQYRKLSAKKQDAIDRALLRYLSDPENPQLRRHELKAEYTGQVSISAGGDLRIHLLESDGYFVMT